MYSKARQLKFQLLGQELTWDSDRAIFQTEDFDFLDPEQVLKRASVELNEDELLEFLALYRLKITELAAGDDFRDRREKTSFNEIFTLAQQMNYAATQRLFTSWKNTEERRQVGFMRIVRQAPWFKGMSETLPTQLLMREFPNLFPHVAEHLAFDAARDVARYDYFMKEDLPAERRGFFPLDLNDPSRGSINDKRFWKPAVDDLSTDLREELSRMLIRKVQERASAVFREFTHLGLVDEPNLVMKIARSQCGKMAYYSPNASQESVDAVYRRNVVRFPRQTAHA